MTHVLPYFSGKAKTYKVIVLEMGISLENINTNIAQTNDFLGSGNSIRNSIGRALTTV